MKLALAALALSACTLVPSHPYPLPADPLEARAARVDAWCGDPMDFHNPWAHETYGSAVLMSATTAVTASHVVACPEIPVVHITLADGHITRTIVAGDDGTIAWLHTVNDNETWFGSDYPAWPRLGEAHHGAVACAGEPREEFCGNIRDVTARELAFDAPAFPGESGAGVWDGEFLIGVVQGIAENGDTVASRVR